MSHFFLDRAAVRLESTQRVTLQGPWPGAKVQHHNEKGSDLLIVMPTEVPLVKPGMVFGKIGMEFPILVPYIETPGKYKDVRKAGLNRKARPDAEWWISLLTVDPFHILIAWNGRDTVNYQGEGGNLIQLARA